MLRKYKINDHILRWGYDSGINIEQFISDFDRFYESQKQISITLSSLGTFLNPGALFLAPVPSKEFLEIHGNHHNYFEIYRLNIFRIIGYFNDLGAVCWRATASPFVQLTGNVMYSAVECLKFHCSLGTAAIVGAIHNMRKEYPGSMDPMGYPLR